MLSLKRRKVLEAIAATFGASLLGGCGGGGGDGYCPPPPPAPPPDCWVVYPNPCDPRILALKIGTGGQITLLGNKSVSGEIEATREMMFIDAAENITSARFIPEENKIVGRGADIQLSVSRTGATWGVGLLAGAEQLEMQLADSAASGAAGQAAARASRPLRLALDRQQCNACAKASVLSGRAPAMIGVTADIGITGCAGPAPDVFVHLRDEGGNLLDVPVALPSGDNLFTAVLLSPDMPDEAVSAAVGQAQALLENFDTYESAFAAMLADLRSLSLTGVRDRIITSLKSQGRFDAACEQFAVFAGLHAGASDAERTGRLGTLLETALEPLYRAVDFRDRMSRALQGGLTAAGWSNVDTRYRFGQLQLQAFARMENGRQFASPGSGPLAATGPIPSLAVAADANPSISGVGLEPAFPAAGQDYAVAGVVSCLAPGDVVTFSVRGADGYTDSTTVAVSDQGSLAFTLQLPGGETPARDTAAIRVERGGAEIASRTVSMAFG